METVTKDKDKSWTPVILLAIIAIALVMFVFIFETELQGPICSTPLKWLFPLYCGRWIKPIV